MVLMKQKTFTRCKFFCRASEHWQRRGWDALRDPQKAHACAITFHAACLCAPPAVADDLTGQASVIDGDTLEIHGTRIRLWGIDAPESGQLCRGEDSLQYRCRAKAANDLDAFITRRSLNCIPISLDRYGRTVATCLVCAAD